MTHGLYRVTGKRPYRGHEPGTEFEAVIPPAAERRAVDRGDIILLDRIEPRLPDTYTFPDGWLRPAQITPHPEAPLGASVVPEEE